MFIVHMLLILSLFDPFCFCCFNDSLPPYCEQWEIILCLSHDDCQLKFQIHLYLSWTFVTPDFRSKKPCPIILIVFVYCQNTKWIDIGKLFKQKEMVMRPLKHRCEIDISTCQAWLRWAWDPRAYLSKRT